MNTLQNYFAAMILAAFAALASGCADGPPEPKSVIVTAQEFEFQPVTISAEPGQALTITLVNQGGVSHNLHIDEMNAKTKTIQSGDSDSVTLTVPENGPIRFYCAVPGHEHAGMVGQIIIES